MVMVNDQSLVKKESIKMHELIYELTFPVLFEVLTKCHPGFFQKRAPATYDDTLRILVGSELTIF